MLLLTTLLEIFLLGLVGGAVPGPMMTSVFAEVLGRGFVRSLRVVFHALVAESLVALFVLLAFSWLSVPESVFHLVSLVGAVVLLWLAWQVWHISAVPEEGGEVFPFRKIMLLTVLNGGFWIFWITIAVPRAFSLDVMLPAGHFLFLLVFELGWLAAMVGLAFVFSRFRDLLHRKGLVSLTYKLLAILLTLFALRSAMSGLGYFLG
ncbi:MAG: LysE family transporter [Candidatus Moranbacteria bacterium]|nr:LysE family transporter [Candidatus Moranbacteria bacterium]NTW90141.1 LysE family transporter [Candidatus Moranbacteria bacterium]